MRNRASSLPIPLPAALALLLLLLAALVVAIGRTGSDDQGPLGGGGSQSADLIDWKLFGRVPERIHYLRSDINPPLKQIWEYNDQALIEFPPAIADGRVFLVNKYSNVRALDAETGKVVWDLRRDKRYKGPPTDVTAPVFGSEAVFVAFQDGALVALIPKTGKVQWKRRIPSRLESSPLVIGQTLYVGSDRGTLYAFDANTGAKRWSYQADATIKASPSYASGRIYFGDYDGEMFALDAKTGRQIWRTDTETLPPGGGGGFYSSPAIANGLVYAGRDNGTVYALDQRTGKYAWHFQTGNDIYGSPAVANVPGTPGPTVYIGSYDKHLYALDALNGKMRWRYDVGGGIPGTAVVIGHTVYTSSFATGRSIGIDVRSHKRVFRFGSPGYTPMISDGQSLFLVGYYSVHRFEPKR
jgi:outer membrane protein assembly factor BamB